MSARSIAVDLIELQICPVCGSDTHSAFESIDEGIRTVDYRLCENCGTVFQSPRMTDEALDSYYEAEYISQHQHASGVTDKELRIQAGRARNLLKLLSRNVVSVERYLDIGSSTGSLMVTVREAYDCDAYGVEPADVYRAYCTARGLTVFPELKALAGLDGPRFDLITMAHVVEHLPDPVGYLRDLRETWLSPGSTVLIEVPNLFGHRSVEIPHLFCFSAGTLHYTLARAGYEVVAMGRHGAPRSRLIPLYLTAIARPLTGDREVRLARTTAAGGDLPRNIKSSARMVRLRRRTGMAWHRLATRFAPGWAWLPLPSLNE